MPIRSYKPKTPVFGMPIGLPNIASASSGSRFISKALCNAVCMANTPTRLPKKPGVSLQRTIPLPISFSLNLDKHSITSGLVDSPFTISSNCIYRTGLK